MQRVSRVYRGPLKAVIFDWAGTIVDYGSTAPVVAFMETFKREGVPIDAATARGPMGKNKRDHISEIAYSPAVSAAWAAARGSAPSEADIDRMYAGFTPLQIEAVRSRCEPVPGAVDVFAFLRSKGMKIGSDSGYNREIMEVVLAEAKKRGLEPDATEYAQGANGRPKPWMSTSVAAALDVYPLCSIVKVDDTIPGILEGLNAGMWTVGVARSGNELGLSLEEAAAAERADPAGFKARLAAAHGRLAAAGAHYVVDSVADLPDVITAINARMAKGGTPLTDADE